MAQDVGREQRRLAGQPRNAEHQRSIAHMATSQHAARHGQPVNSSRCGELAHGQHFAGEQIPLAAPAALAGSHDARATSRAST